MAGTSQGSLGKSNFPGGGDGAVDFTKLGPFEPFYALTPGAVFPLSTITGVLAGTSAGTASQAGALLGAGALAAAVTGTGSQTGTMTGAAVLAGTAAGAATDTSALTGAAALAASTTGSADHSGELTGAGELASSASGSATTTAAATGSATIAGAISGTTTATASLGGAIGAAGSISGDATPSGAIAGTAALTGAASGSATLTGDLTGATSTVELTGIASAQAFGTPTIKLTVQLSGVASPEAFGTTVVGGPQTISLTGVPSREAFGRISVSALAGVIAGANEDKTGPMTGGQAITISAPGVQMETAEDLFADGSIDNTRWTQTVTGSGVIIEVPGDPRGVLQLSTGATASSTATLRTQSTASQFDVSADFLVSSMQVRSVDAQVSFWLSARASATTYFRASIDMTRGSKILRLRGLENGAEQFAASIPIANVATIRLRILRDEEDIYVFLNDALTLKTRWTTTAAAIEMGVANSADGGSLTASITRYTRFPVVLFGETPMLYVTSKSRGRIDGLTPPVTKAEDVTIHVVTDTSTYDLHTSYAYVQTDDPRRVGGSGTSSLTVISDKILRN